MPSKRKSNPTPSQARSRRPSEPPRPGPMRGYFSESPPGGAGSAADRVTQAAIQWQHEAAELARSSGPYPPLVTPYQALKLWAKAWELWASALAGP